MKEWFYKVILAWSETVARHYREKLWEIASERAIRRLAGVK